MSEEARCPKCRSVLEDEERNGVTLNKCTDCGGHWFSADAVGSAITGTGAHPSSHVNLYALSKFATGIKGRAEGLLCPACRTETLDVHVYDDVEVEFCGTCYGLFLDEGELRRIVAYRKRRNWKERRDNMGEFLRSIFSMLGDLV